MSNCVIYKRKYAGSIFITKYKNKEVVIMFNNSVYKNYKLVKMCSLSEVTNYNIPASVAASVEGLRKSCYYFYCRLHSDNYNKYCVFFQNKYKTLKYYIYCLPPDLFSFKDFQKNKSYMEQIKPNKTYADMVLFDIGSLKLDKYNFLPYTLRDIDGKLHDVNRHTLVILSKFIQQYDYYSSVMYNFKNVTKKITSKTSQLKIFYN